MNLRELAPPSDLPAPDARVPVLVLRVLVAVLGISLTLVVFGASDWLLIGIPFSLVAAWAPEYLLGWAMIVFLAIGELDRPAGLRWQLLVLLAGAHLLHLLGSLTLALPWRSWIQPVALRAPLLRFLAIQVPAQLLAVVTLLLLAPNAHGQRPVTVAALGVVGGAALAGLAVLMFRRPPEAGS